MSGLLSNVKDTINDSIKIDDIETSNESSYLVENNIKHRRYADSNINEKTNFCFSLCNNNLISLAKNYRMSINV